MGKRKEIVVSIDRTDYNRDDQASVLLCAGTDPSNDNREDQSPFSLWPELAEIVAEVEAEKADGVEE